MNPSLPLKSSNPDLEGNEDNDFSFLENPQNAKPHQLTKDNWNLFLQQRYNRLNKLSDKWVALGGHRESFETKPVPEQRASLVTLTNRVKFSIHSNES